MEPAPHQDEEEEDDDDGALLEEAVAGALDWADRGEDLASRGGGGGGGASSHHYAGTRLRPNAHGGRAARGQLRGINSAGKAWQPRQNAAQKLTSKVDLHLVASEAYSAPGVMAMNATAATGVRKAERRLDKNTLRVKDKADRATVENAIDPRTRLVLFKMLNNGLFDEIHGCVATGKEANVYHAIGEEHGHLAVKVYKTSVLVFKDRDRYVTGDWRFRRGYAKHNPRKMVKVWAEKETRNLLRLAAAGIPCPRPVQLRLHVLAMEFIGTDDRAAPRLKDAALDGPRMCSAYVELITHMRTMYQKCRLVHADLSEYNILYHEDRLWIIDVSQAADLDNPNALVFLREDCKHVNDFFGRREAVKTLSNRELFDFCTDPALRDEQVDEYLDEMLKKVEARAGLTEREKADDAVFHSSYLPTNMDDIVHYDRDFNRLQDAAEGRQGTGAENIFYQKLIGMKSDWSGVNQMPEILQEKRNAALAAAAGAGVAGLRLDGDSASDSASDSGSGSASDSASEGEGAGEGAGEGRRNTPQRLARKGLTKEEVRELRNANKKAVKAEAREKRKTKTPKKVKKAKHKKRR